MKNFNSQRGEALIMGIMAMAVVIIVVAVIFKIASASLVLAIRTSDADGLKQITQSAQYYAERNKELIKLSKAIQGIANPNAPTLQELVDQKYLTAEGAGITSPFGQSYKISITVQPNGSITGFVYLTGPIVSNSGQPDQRRACEIARKLGEIGFCTSDNPGLIGNGTTQFPNPGGNIPASIAGYIFVSV